MTPPQLATRTLLDDHPSSRRPPSAPTVPSPYDVKVRDLLRLLADDGWRIVRTRGSHRQLAHPTKRGLVTIAGTGNHDLAPGTLKSILKQAGLTPQRPE